MPGSLSQMLLYGEKTVQEMEPSCHEVSRPYLMNTKAIIDQETLCLFHGVDLRDTDQVNEIRVLLKVAGKLTFWEDHVPFTVHNHIVDILKKDR